MIFNENTELRKLGPAEFNNLALILSRLEGWKKLANMVTKEGTEGIYAFDETTREIFEDASRVQRKTEAAIFLEEWSTMGRIKRPTLGLLHQLLIKAGLFIAADYLAFDVLKVMPGSGVPNFEGTDICLRQMNYPMHNETSDSDYNFAFGDDEVGVIEMQYHQTRSNQVNDHARHCANSSDAFDEKNNRFDESEQSESLSIFKSNVHATENGKTSRTSIKSEISDLMKFNGASNELSHEQKLEGHSRSDLIKFVSTRMDTNVCERNNMEICENMLPNFDILLSNSLSRKERNTENLDKSDENQESDASGTRTKYDDAQIREMSSSELPTVLKDFEVSNYYNRELMSSELPLCINDRTGFNSSESSSSQQKNFKTEMNDLSKIPLVALSIDTRILVSTLLNPKKWLLTGDGLPRDWRGLAQLLEISGEKLPSLETHFDPTEKLLTIAQNKTPSCTIKDLESMLSKIERWDIIDDALTSIERDAEKYVVRMERCKSSAEQKQDEVEEKILTMDDLYRFERGMEKQYYDAFVLFAEEDMEFVKEMINNLEDKHRLKLCLKERDLMPGVPYGEAVMQLIRERCNRLIVVVSPDFLESPENKFFTKFGQSVGIVNDQRKIIPCLYKRCQLPAIFTYLFVLDYARKELFDFWRKLYDSVRVTTHDNSARSPLPTQPSESAVDNIACSRSPVDTLKKINGSVSSPITEIKWTKTKNTKKLIVWPKKKREKDELHTENEIELITESVSVNVNLPSLDNLPSLETVESTRSNKLTNRTKNIVGTCFNKVQSLLSKQ